MKFSEIPTIKAHPEVVQAVLQMADEAFRLYTGGLLTVESDLGNLVPSFYFGSGNNKPIPCEAFAQLLAKRYGIHHMHLSVGCIQTIATLVTVLTLLNPGGEECPPSEQAIAFVILRRLGIEPAKLTAEARLIEHLGLDSLDMVQVVMDLEEFFGMEIPDEAAGNFTTVRDILKFYQIEPL